MSQQENRDPAQKRLAKKGFERVRFEKRHETFPLSLETPALQLEKKNPGAESVS